MAKAPKALCHQCPLKDEPFVPPSGDANARCVIVGEGPGRTEVAEGKPFVGQSGKLLDAVLKEVGIDPEDTYRTNVVMCRPPGNRAPTEREVNCCLPRLKEELKHTKNPVLALGKSACEALKIDWTQRGAWLYSDVVEKTVKPAWHPAYVLRRPSEATMLIAELRSYARGEGAQRIFEPEVIWAESPKHLIELLLRCPDDAWVAFDIETNNVMWYDRPDKMSDAILMLQLAWDVDFGVVVSDELIYDYPETAEILQEFFNRVKTVGHNAKFDAVFLRSHIGVNPNVTFDTLLAQYILDENMPLGLKTLAALEFGIADYEKELISMFLKSRNDDYSKIPPVQLAEYGVLDVICTLELRERFEERLRENGQYETPFMDIIMPASHALENVELRGFQIDGDALKKVSKLLQEKIEETTQKLRDIAGDPELNPNSPQQLSEIIYHKLRLPQPRSYKIKKGSTNAAALEALKDEHEIIPAIKQYRRVKKLFTSYVNNVAPLRDKEGRVHGNFLIYGTEVGRLSVRDPALQTIARPDDEYGGMIRGMYCAKPGYKLIHADYSQAELRVMACYSQEPFLLDAYRNDRDLHSEVARAMYGPNFTKADRVICKMFNFSYVYGGSEYSFADSAGLPVDTARNFVRQYNANMPQALKWKSEQFKRAQKQGYVETIFGRRRHFPLITRTNLDEVRKSCVHMVIASTASDLTLKSLIQIENEGIPVVLSVHDSVLAEVPEAQAEEAARRMEQIMEEMGRKYLPDVPWKVDAEIRQHWYES